MLTFEEIKQFILDSDARSEYKQVSIVLVKQAFDKLKTK